MTTPVPTVWRDVPILMTVRDFAAKHPSFKKSTLRDLIWRANHPESPRYGWDATGFNLCTVRMGRKLLLDEAKVFAWLGAQQKGAKHG